jgi:hypothetical protein
MVSDTKWESHYSHCQYWSGLDRHLAPATSNASPPNTSQACSHTDVEKLHVQVHCQVTILCSLVMTTARQKQIKRSLCSWKMIETVMARRPPTSLVAIFLEGGGGGEAMPPHVPYGLRSLPSRLWPKCNRLLRLGRPWVIYIPAFLKLWSADHKWSSGSALVVLLDWTLVQKDRKILK